MIKKRILLITSEAKTVLTKSEAKTVLTKTSKDQTDKLYKHHYNISKRKYQKVLLHFKALTTPLHFPLELIFIETTMPVFIHILLLAFSWKNVYWL